MLQHYVGDAAVNLLGHSKGGGYAAGLYAGARPERIKSLQKTNPRLSDQRAIFLARHWSRQNDVGRWAILGDPANKVINPLLPRVDEMIACWRCIAAPVLCVEVADTNMWRWMGGKAFMRDQVDRRIACLSDARSVVVADAGHMLHHDQPQVLAMLIEHFLQDHGGR